MEIGNAQIIIVDQAKVSAVFTPSTDLKRGCYSEFGPQRYFPWKIWKYLWQFVGLYFSLWSLSFNSDFNNCFFPLL